jgi:plasmid maintenance system antidote protein VapI
MVETMTRKEFLLALDQLGLSKNAAPETLGIARSTVYRICNGSSEVPEVVAKLIEQYRQHGVPK